MAARVVPQDVQPAQPAMRIESAVVPAGAGPGQSIPVRLGDGSMFEVVVPPGVEAGQTFQFQLPEPQQTCPVVAVAEPIPPVAAGQPIAPVMAQPAAAAVVISGQPVQQGMVVPASGPNMQWQTNMHAMHLETSMVPPGAPSGGWMVRESYCGPNSWMIACVMIICNMGPAALFIPCCPCDQRDTYVAPDGRKFLPDGRVIGTSSFQGR